MFGRWLFNDGSRRIIFNSLYTGNNQRIRSADDNDRRSKCFLLQHCALRKFHVTDSENMCDQIFVIRFRVIEGPNVHDQIAFCAFHSFLVEVQTNSDYIHVTHAQ